MSDNFQELDELYWVVFDQFVQIRDTVKMKGAFHHDAYQQSFQTLRFLNAKFGATQSPESKERHAQDLATWCEQCYFVLIPKFIGEQ